MSARLLVIIPRHRAVERVAFMQGFAGRAEIIIDRRVLDRRQRPVGWEGSRCRRRAERRGSHSEGSEYSLVFAS